MESVKGQKNQYNPVLHAINMTLLGAVIVIARLFINIFPGSAYRGARLWLKVTLWLEKSAYVPEIIYKTARNQIFLLSTSSNR